MEKPTKKRTSLGDLIRSAVERQYGLGGSEERLRAARALAELRLPVGAPEDVKRESVPRAEELLP